MGSEATSYIGEADFATRNDAQKRLAEMTGLRLPTTRVPEGEALWDIGQQAKQALESQVDDLPYFRDAIGLLKDRIKAEDPRDYMSIPVQQLMMNAAERPTFSVVPQPDIPALGYTRVGFSHMVDAVKPSGTQGLAGNMLAISDPKVRASVFNHFAARAFERNKTPVHLRTICEPKSGVRVLRAVTSEKHSLESGDDLAVVGAMESQLASALDKAKLRITRDLERTYMECLWPAMKREIRVGDTVLIGVRVRNSETKQGSLRVEPFVLDALCYNFTTAESTGGDEEVIIRHVGDLGGKLAEVFTRCLAKVEPFIKAFGDAYRVKMPETRGELLQRVQRVFELPDGLIRQTEAAWNEQALLHQSPGDTLADLVNAMTKASQAQTMDDAMVTGRAAGKLVSEGFQALAS